jgi:hypothetical protein
MKYPERHKIHPGCPGVQTAASAVCLSTSGRHDLRPLITDGRTIRTRKKASSSSHGTGFGRADRTEPGFK